jgi:transcriptional regulator with PAS, ATPase and Fis domain
MQAKLLRAVQERRVRLVGDPREYPQGQPLDVRLVAATNRDLVEEKASGAFRTDLYYRLHVLPIDVPPLRERREDVPTLLAAFLNARSRKAEAVSEVDDDVVPLLRQHAWPGNVRELENAVERSLLRLRFEGGGVLRAMHFDLGPGQSHGADRLCRQVAEAILEGEVEPESVQPRPVEGEATFGTKVYRMTAAILRSRGELSQKKLAEVWHLQPGSIGPLNTACDVQLRKRTEQ